MRKASRSLAKKEVVKVVAYLPKKPEKQQGTNRPLKPPIKEGKG